MSKRKGIPKKVRFEVFKRDAFRCQYCGEAAPDVILEIDHIKPVAGGGDNTIANLVAACRDCNAGKGARELSDRAALEKQRKQLDDLSERRNQLEMMVEWREELTNLNESELSAVCQAIESFETGLSPSETGKSKIKKWIKKYSVKNVLAATHTSFEQYIKWDGDELVPESWDKAFSYIPRIINVNLDSVDEPYLKDLFYIRGILRNRLAYVDEPECMKKLKEAVKTGGSIESLREFSKSVQSWERFCDVLDEFVEEHGGLD